MSGVYQVNKGVNRPIVFRGLKAQYIWWLAIGLSVLLILFAVLYIVGMPGLVAIGVIVVLGCILFYWIYRCNNRYGEFGMMKRLARKAIPKWIRCDQSFKQ